MWSDVSELLAALILEDVFSDRCLWMHTAEALKRPRLPLRWRRRALSHSAMFGVWTTTTASVLGMRSNYIIINCIGIDKFLINSRAAYTLNRENVPLLDNTTYNKLNVYIEPLICQNSISQNSLRHRPTQTLTSASTQTKQEQSLHKMTCDLLCHSKGKNKCTIRGTWLGEVIFYKGIVKTFKSGCISMLFLMDPSCSSGYDLFGGRRSPKGTRRRATKEGGSSIHSS